MSCDGTSIVYFSAYGLDQGEEENEFANDYGMCHYHIPKSTRTVITNTTHKHLDDACLIIYYSGEVSDFDLDYYHSMNQ